ncbi:MAG: hypothetical protein DRJ05_18585, partial [Bacteroidetes bacterium]
AGKQALYSNTTGLSNTALGESSLFSNTTASGNTAVGNRALYSNSTGDFNTATGRSSLILNSTGTKNVANGESALFQNTTGNENTVMGYSAQYYNTTGSNNVAIGTEANLYNQTGTENTIVGHEAGQGTSTHSKTGNVFIGYRAGYNDITSNKLYIENSSSSTPLIYGDFANDSLRFNGNTNVIGTLNINDAYSFPTTDGTNGQVLSTNGSGVLSFSAFDVDDNDADSTNELNTNVVLNGNNLEVTDAGGTLSADLSLFLDNTDAQTLTITNDSLSISGGDTVNLASYLDNTDVQTLTITNDSLSITGGDTVSLVSYLDNTDAQTLSISNDSITISNGNQIDLSPYLDADNLGNHIATQNIQLNANWLSNDGGNEGIRIDNDGNVGIGTTAPEALLDIVSATQAHMLKLENTTAGGDFLTMIGDTGDTIFDFNSESLVSKEVIKIYDGNVQGAEISADPAAPTYFHSGNVGIGIKDPQVMLHLGGSDFNQGYIRL